MQSSSSVAGPRQASRSWIWMFAFACLLIVLGVIAMGALLLSARLFIVVLGWLLIGAGVLQIGGAFLYRGFGGFFAEVFFGALSILLGLLMLWSPVTVGSLVALMIVGGLILDAVLEGVRAFIERRFAWWLPVLIALLSLGLGLFMLFNPAMLLPLLGLLVGANLFVRGVILLLIAIEARSLSRRGL